MFTDEEFVVLAQKHMDTIFRVAYSWLKNSEDANDVTQDVLLQLYRTDKSFDSDDHIKHWLIRVTINRCKMIFRAPFRRNENIDDYAETLGFEQTEYSELFDAVMKLDKKYRVPLLLFYYDGYSTSDIAELLGISKNTVSTRLFRARDKLKSVLEEEMQYDE